MKAIFCENNALVLREVAIPTPKAGEVLIKVAYAGVNRADILQRKGLYPVPEGASEILGLEVSGTIAALGKNVSGWKKGDKVAALLSGGGYTEYCTAPAALLLPVPRRLSLKEAAALPEALFTVFLAVVRKTSPQKGESILIHSGASGIGTLTIQLMKALELTVYATAGTDKKCRMCEMLGAAKAINYKKQDFVEALLATTGGKGVNIILDTTGGDNLAKNIRLLAMDGRISLISFLRGAKAEINLAALLAKRGTLYTTTLRNQPLPVKKTLRKQIARLWSLMEKTAVSPLIDSEFPLSQAKKAHKRMEENLNIGKITLKV